MYHFRHLSLRQLVLICLVAAGLLALSVSGAFAFANTYIASYNLSSSDPTYGPNGGQIWASNISPHNPSLPPQRLQAENWAITWSASAATNVRSTYSKLGPVFHVFDATNPGGQTNCALPFDYDGYFVSSQSDAWVETKNATCGLFGQYNTYNNEARVYWPASEVYSGQSYYGGAEFKLDNGDLYITKNGKVSNDVYFNSTFSERKDQILNGTWCFDGTNNHQWNC